MSSPTPEQARAALAAAERAEQQVTAEIGLPRAYWWCMAGGWMALGAIGQFAPAWVTTVATIVFAVAHSMVASRLFDGTRASRHLQVSRAVADRRIPFLIIGILLAAVAFTIAAAIALDADGAGHPSLWAGVIVGLVIGFGEPDLLRALRHRFGA
ncbi:hypothetical protein ACWDTI_16260 [Gordonia sp. NPDC003424]